MAWDLVKDRDNFTFALQIPWFRVLLDSYSIKLVHKLPA